MMKLEYLILIILALGFYETTYKDSKKRRKDRIFIENNLQTGSKITTKSGIIAEVINIDGEKVLLITGDPNHKSYMTVKKSEIASIIG